MILFFFLLLSACLTSSVACEHSVYMWVSVQYNVLPVLEFNYAFSGGLLALSKSIMHFIHTGISEREIVNNGKNLKRESSKHERHKQSNYYLRGKRIKMCLGIAHNPHCSCEFSPKHFGVLCPPVHSLWQSSQRSRNYYKGHKEK